MEMVISESGGVGVAGDQLDPEATFSGPAGGVGIDSNPIEVD